MKETNFLLRAEDEMDFMPIIPLNESDNEALNDVEVPRNCLCYHFATPCCFPALCSQLLLAETKALRQ